MATRYRRQADWLVQAVLNRQWQPVTDARLISWCRLYSTCGLFGYLRHTYTCVKRIRPRKVIIIIIVVVVVIIVVIVVVVVVVVIIIIIVVVIIVIIIIVIIIIIIIIYSLIARVAGAPQMILQPVFSIFPCTPLPSGTCRTPGLSIP